MIQYLWLKLVKKGGMSEINFPEPGTVAGALVSWFLLQCGLPGWGKEGQRIMDINSQRSLDPKLGSNFQLGDSEQVISFSEPCSLHL